jgi:hypothetical protein
MKGVIELYRRIGGFQALHAAEAYDVLKEAVEQRISASSPSPATW